MQNFIPMKLNILIQPILISVSLSCYLVSDLFVVCARLFGALLQFYFRDIFIDGSMRIIFQRNLLNQIIFSSTFAFSTFFLLNTLFTLRMRMTFKIGLTHLFTLLSVFFLSLKLMLMILLKFFQQSV